VLHRLKARIIGLKRLRAGGNGFVGCELRVWTEIDEFADNRIAGVERDRLSSDIAFNSLDRNADRGHVRSRRHRILKTNHSAYGHARLCRNVIGGGHKVGFVFKGPGPAGGCSARLIKEVSICSETRLKAPGETDAH